MVGAVLPPPEYEGQPGHPRSGTKAPERGRPEGDSPTRTQLVPPWGILSFNCGIVGGGGGWPPVGSLTRRNAAKDIPLHAGLL